MEVVADFECCSRIANDSLITTAQQARIDELCCWSAAGLRT